MLDCPAMRPRSGRVARAFAVALQLAAAACRPPGLSDEKALELVRNYNERVIAAYRHADAALVEGVAAPDEAKKLTGLIGVKIDQGVFMEASLLELRAASFVREGEKVVVETRERWYYRDRRMQSGEQVGQDSTDTYHLRYTLRQFDGRWLVEQVDFASAPQVGRTEVPTQGDIETMHGISLRDDIAMPTPGKEAKP